MKTKMNIIKTLAITAIATAAVAAGALTAPATASANDVFQMKAGAAVRMDVTADESAIRFIANVPDLTDKGYRMLIVPTKILEANGIAADGDVVKALKTAYGENYANYFVDLEVKPFVHEEYGNVVMGAMKKINSARYAEQYTGIAYYEDNGEYKYAAFAEGEDFYSNARSVSYVASAALNSGKYETSETATHKGILEGFVASGLEGGEFDVEQYNEVAKISDVLNLSYNNVSTTELDVKYVSSNTDVATVDADGKVTVLAKGETTITASIGNSFTDSVKVNAFTAGTKKDMLFATHYTKDSTTIASNATKGLLDVDVKAFEDGQAKPVDTATAYVEYDMTAKKYDKYTYVANFLNFSADNAIQSELVNANTDWNNAFLRFYIYNNTTHPTFHLFEGNSSKYITNEWSMRSLASKAWTKVELSLKDVFGVTKETYESGAYDIRLFAYFVGGAEDHTETGYTNFAANFYVTGFEIFTPDENEMLATNYTAKGTAINRFYTTQLATQVKAFASAPTEVPVAVTSYIEYTMTATAKNGNEYVGNFFDFSATHPINAQILGKYSAVDWDNAYIRFYVYNDNDYKLQIFHAGDGKYATQWRVVPAARTWTEVKISLKDYYSVTKDAITNGTYDIKLYAQFTNTNCHADDTYQNFLAKFYVTGFEFVSGI